MTASRIHPQSLCETDRVGPGTRVGAFAHVLPGAVIGRDCDIGDHVFIESGAVLGDRVTVKCGVQLWDGMRIGDDVFIGPNAAFPHDTLSRSEAHPQTIARTVIEAGASIEANATLLPGVTIGRRAVVGAGAVVTRNVPPRAIVTGNPAQIAGYVDPVRRPDAVRESRPGHAVEENLIATSVRGVTLRRLKTVYDLRGHLSVGHFGTEVPFLPRRYFVVFDVPGKDIRGEHAHRKCHQFLICVKGSLSVIVDDGSRSEEIVLATPSLGLYLPPMVWCVQYKHDAGTALLVFASDPYDPSDYIREYQEFLESVAAASNDRAMPAEAIKRYTADPSA
jgi:acetyltransferase-like isoleucine patch superfamily enzyme